MGAQWEEEEYDQRWLMFVVMAGQSLSLREA